MVLFPSRLIRKAFIMPGNIAAPGVMYYLVVRAIDRRSDRYRQRGSDRRGIPLRIAGIRRAYLPIRRQEEIDGDGQAGTYRPDRSNY